MLLIFIALSLTPTLLLAQSTRLTTQVKTSKTRWSGFTSVGYSSNLQERNSFEQEAFVTGDLMVNYHVQGSNLVRAFMSGYQEQNRGQESKLNDGYIGWVNNSLWKTGKILTIGQQARAIIPSSKESRVRDEKIFGATVATPFILNLTPVGFLGVTLVYQPQLTKNFHTYQQNKLNQNNPEYSINQSLSLNWSITDQIYLAPAFIYGSSWSYGGVKRDDAYQFALETGYSWASGITMDLGVTNAGAIRNFENGNDQTIQLFDNKTASVYSELLYAF
jgi:hypothetical protein